MVILATKLPKYSQQETTLYQHQQEHSLRLLHYCYAKATNEENLPEIIRPGGGKKPYFAHSTWEYNLSHSGTYLLCGVGSQPVGVDIQVNRPVSTSTLRVAQRVCTPQELEWLVHQPEQAFTLLWVMKESFVKVQGKALGSGRWLAHVDLPLPDCRLSRQHLCNDKWHFILEQQEGVSLCVCTSSPIETPIEWIDF